MSGSRAGDAKQWRDPGGGAGVADQRGGDIAVAVETEADDGDVDALDRAAGLLAGELAGAVGLPEEAEADEAHSLTISFE
jgi:hypothetical protein